MSVDQPPADQSPADQSPADQSLAQQLVADEAVAEQSTEKRTSFWPRSWKELLDHCDRWQRSLPLTYEGKIWLLATLGMFSLGLWRSINLIILLACFLLAALFFNWRLARRQLALRGKRIHEEEMFAQEPCTVNLEAFNPGNKPLACVWLEQETQGWYVPRLEPKELAHLDASLIFPVRGRHQLTPLLGRSGFPLGLADCRKELQAGEEVVIFPRLGILRRGVLRRLLQRHSPTLGLARTVPRRHPTAQTDFHGLRTFQPGDTPRWIHWRTSARCGELMVREFEDTPSDNLILIVDPHIPADAAEPDPMLELAISLAATICWEWCRHHGDRLVCAVGGREPSVLPGVTGKELSHAILTRLATEPGSAQTDVPQLLERLNTPQLPAAPVLLISTHACEFAGELEQAFRRPIASVDVSRQEHADFFEEKRQGKPEEPIVDEELATSHV